MFPHACSPGRQRALGCLVDTIRRTALQGCLKVFNWTSASTANEAQVNTEGQGYRAHWTQHCVCFERQHRVYKQKHSDVVQPSLQNSTAGSRAQIISFRIRFIVSTEATEQLCSKWLRAWMWLNEKQTRKKIRMYSQYPVIWGLLNIALAKRCYYNRLVHARLTWKISPRSLFS